MTLKGAVDFVAFDWDWCKYYISTDECMMDFDPVMIKKYPGLNVECIDISDPELGVCFMVSNSAFFMILENEVRDYFDKYKKS